VNKHKFYIDADIKVEKNSKELWEAASNAINLPKGIEKQPDLLYFSAIFVSSGENLNHAFFLPSELVAAEDTIINKALDVEHKEEDIIGHIYDRAFVDAEGTKIETAELAAKDPGSLNTNDIHVAIAGIVYKNRFPNVAKEVAEGSWKVSMECYFTDYDIKVGELIVTKQEAELLGLLDEESSDSTFGKIAKVLKNGKELAKGTITRVLRGIVFSGCGIVKNPANPPSVILETANKNKQDEEVDIVANYDDLKDKDVSNANDSNKLTSHKVEESVITDENKEHSDGPGVDDNVGICVNYKRYLYATEPAGPDTELLQTDWCTLYEESCASFSRDTTDPECLRNVNIRRFARACVEDKLQEKKSNDRRGELLDTLENVLSKTKK